MPPQFSHLIASAVASHETAAFRTERSVAHDIGFERQSLLRLRLGRSQLRRLARFRRFGNAQESRAQPAENVVNDRLGVRNLLDCRSSRLAQSARG